MKQPKNAAIMAILAFFFVFTCLFLVCEDVHAAGESIAAEISESSSDHVYATGIDADSVITERELDAMNKIRLVEFVGELPERQKIGKPFKGVQNALTDEEIREIVWEYIADSPRIEEDLQYTYGVRCYGKFDGAYAVMIDGPRMYTDAIRNEAVAGYVFTFSNGQRMYIYKEGEFYTLLKAYELGIISEKNVAEIEWKKTKPYTCAKASTPVELT